MRTQMENEALVCFLEGRITSENSSAVGEAIRAAMAEHPGAAAVLDADALTYITSAGLRVLLALGKEAAKLLMIRNVSPEVYQTLDITGFTSLMDVRRKPREVSIDGCEIIGSGAVGTVYRLDEDTVLKLYRNAAYYPMLENELKRSKQAFLKGIPTAIPFDIVRVGDCLGTVFEMVKAESCNDALVRHPENANALARQYAAFLKTIHSVETEPGELPDARDTFRNYLRLVTDRLPKETFERVNRLLEALPYSGHVLHGDPQMKNVMMANGEMMLIDMDTLCVGDPVFELAGLYMSYICFTSVDPNDAMEFLGVERDVIQRVYHTFVEAYAETSDPDRLREVEDRAALMGCLRYLYVLTVLHMCKPGLEEVSLAFALDHINELAARVETLKLL